VPVKKYLERPYEKRVEVPVEHIRENIIYKDKIIDCEESELFNFYGNRFD
jgi:hypothetical protein